VGKIKTCGICGGRNHNARTCSEKKAKIVIGEDGKSREETETEIAERLTQMREEQKKRVYEEQKQRLEEKRELETSAEVSSSFL
jgi:hypothetical protein